MADAVLAGVVSWLVGESLKNSAQIYGQQFPMGTVIIVEPPANGMSVEATVKLFSSKAYPASANTVLLIRASKRNKRLSKSLYGCNVRKLT